MMQSGASAYSTREHELPKKAAIRDMQPAMAPWQARCIQGYIAVNLHTTISTMDLGRVVNFRPFRLNRAFRVIFGCTPHQYVIRRRIARAQSLMLMSNDSLGQIAAECGFVDQSHLSNLFYKVVGTRPGAWRRIRTAQH
ncbi:MAG TPA: AraC family transcriptional regulator [Steroidobacteraceae bacterium]|nr:AraC family transcriptional regulator [Steroidobacteraceae bacterium]